MPLYPLPPSSNESVIDNEKNVWQMAINAKSKCTSKKKNFKKVKIIFTTGKSRCLRRADEFSPSSPQPARTCTCIMPSVLCVQGRFSGGSASIVKWARRQSQTVEEEYEFYVFFFLFLFLHADIAQKRPAGVDIPILSVELERVPTSAFKSNKAQSTSANDRRLRACTRWLPWRSENDSQHSWDMTLQAPPPYWFFFFFEKEKKKGRRGKEGERVENLGQGDFFAVDRTTNRVQTPSPRYERSFVCPRCVKFWDDPLGKICLYRNYRN